MDDDDSCIAKGANDTDQKIVIVGFSHTIIKPHAVMVKFVDTSITCSTVLAVGQAVAVAVLAE